MSALLQHGWSVGGGFFSSYMHDWVGTVDMDPVDPMFAGLLLEQVRLWWPACRCNYRSPRLSQSSVCARCQLAARDLCASLHTQSRNGCVVVCASPVDRLRG